MKRYGNAHAGAYAVTLSSKGICQKKIPADFGILQPKIYLHGYICHFLDIFHLERDICNFCNLTQKDDLSYVVTANADFYITHKHIYSMLTLIFRSGSFLSLHFLLLVRIFFQF